MSQNNITSLSTKTVIKCSICSLTFESVEQSKQHYHCVIPVTNYFLVPPTRDQQQTTPIVNIQPLSINVSVNQGGNIQQANIVNTPSIKLENFQHIIPTVCLPPNNQNITLTSATENSITNINTAQLNTTNITQIITPAVGVKRSHENEIPSTKSVPEFVNNETIIQDTASPTKKSRVLKTVLFPCTICGEKLMNVKKLVEHLNLTGHVNSMVCATCKTYIHGTESFESIQHHFSNCSTLTPNNKKVALIAASSPSSNSNSEIIPPLIKSELNNKVIIQKSDESKIIAIQDSSPTSPKNQQGRHQKSKSLKAALKKSKKFMYFCATCCEKFGDKKVFDDHCKCCLHVSTVIQSVKEKLNTETMTANTPGYRLNSINNQCSNKPKKDEFICFACKGNFKSFQLILNHFEYCISIKTFMISVLDKCYKISKDKDDPKLFYCLDCSMVCNKLNSILLHIIKECNYHSKNYFGLKHAVEKNNTLGNDLILIFKISASCDKAVEANYSVVLTCKKNEDAARIAEYAAEQNALANAEKLQQKRKLSEQEKDDIFKNTFSTQTNATKNKVPTTKISIISPEVIDINNERGITSENENASEFSPENSKDVTTKNSLSFSLLDFIETQFKCLQCTSYFSSKEQLEAHVKMQHKSSDSLHKKKSCNEPLFPPLISSNIQNCERLSVQVSNVMQNILGQHDSLTSASSVDQIKDVAESATEIKPENIVKEEREEVSENMDENQNDNLDYDENITKIEVSANDIEINYLQFEDQDSLQEIANFGDLEKIIKSLPASLNYESQITNNNYSMPVPDVIDKCQSQNFISTQIENCIMEGLQNSFENSSQTPSGTFECQIFSNDTKSNGQIDMPENKTFAAVDNTINNILNGINESEIEKTLSMCLKNPDIMCSDAIDELDEDAELLNSPLLLVRPCYVLIDRNEVDQYFASSDDEETLLDKDEATTPENEHDVSFENICLKNETFDLLDICVPDDFNL